MSFFFHKKDDHPRAEAVVRPPGCTTFEIISGANMPNLDDGITSGVSDCYVLASLVDGTSGVKLAGTEIVKTTTRKDSLDPTWFTFVSFAVAADPTDVLKLDVYDEDQLSADDHIGTSTEALSALEGGAPVTSTLKMATKVKPKNKQASTVTVRHVSTVGGEEDNGISSSSSVTSHSSRGCATTAATEAEAAAAAGSLPPPQKLKKKKKTVFVIRHGESKWNEAQAAKHVGHMLKQFDHELDTVGITQARDFNAKWKAMAVEAGLLLPLPPDEVKKAEVVEGGEAAGAGAVAAAASTIPSTTASSSQDGDQQQQQQQQQQQLVEFLSAGAIYASPLTRATQTALLTCQDHPFFVGAETTTTATTTTSATAAAAATTISNPETEEGKKKRGGGGALKLVRAVREVKSTPMGSLDTVGERKGGEIKKHVEACLSADGGATLEVEKVLAPEVIHRDATDHWWTSLEAKDSKESLRVRYRDAFMVLRHDNDSAVNILVGHSLFFRNFVRAHLSASFKAEHPALAAELHSKKLDNAACLRCELEWAVGAGADPMAPPEITHAELMFGSGFHEHHQKAGQRRPSSTHTAASAEASKADDDYHSDLE